MAKQVLFTADQKRVVIDRDTDVCLYDAYGYNRTRGRDILAHKTRTGNWYFYSYDWSQWQGESCTVNLLTNNEVESELIELLRRQEIGEETIKQASEMIGHDIFNEDA